MQKASFHVFYNMGDIDLRYVRIPISYVTKKPYKELPIEGDLWK